MATSETLPAGAFITSINGKRCTARPRSNISSASAAVQTTAQTTLAVVTTSSQATLATSTSTTSSSLVAITSSSSTTSSSSIVITTAQTSSTQAVLVPPAAVTTSSAAAAAPLLTNTSTTSVPTFSSVASSSPSQAESATRATGAGTSVADTSITTATATDGQTTRQTTATALPDVASAASSQQLLTDTSSLGAQITTIGFATSSSGAAAASESSSDSTNSAASPVTSTNNSSVQSTVAVAGGVIGGVIAISLIAFLLWWFRRRMMKKRRSTLLTPLTTDPSFMKDEKGAYVIDRGSLGPTPRTEKLKAALGYNLRKVTGGLGGLVGRNNAKSPSVNMNRGNSQFMEPVSQHSRNNSMATGEPHLTTKDKLSDWWSRLTADMNFNWRLRNSGNSASATDAFGRSMKEKSASNGQPDFLTLLGMDDRELDREAQRRRASMGRKNASAGSTDHFLGGLNLSFGSEDPFSDANALAHHSAKPAPLVVSQPNNPFADSNAIREPPMTVAKPTTYVADIRRSRGQSVGGATTRAPSTVYGRDSVSSLESFSTRRNKFRSDPFDLERPELLRGGANGSTSSVGAIAGSNTNSTASNIQPPAGAHTRTDSFTSKYSSGVSLGDWSDPGPDVGPAGGAKWNGPEPRESPTQGWRDRQEKEAAKRLTRNRSTSSAASAGVGKAL